MIVNELQFPELHDLLAPILRLESRDAIVHTWEAILKMSVGAIESGPRLRDRFPLRYKGYELDILHFRWLEAKGMAIHLHFRTRKNWWHGRFKDQNAELIGDLKRICTGGISGLHFARYNFTSLAGQFGALGSPVELVYFHDSRAFNKEWKDAIDISPLLVAPDVHDGRCFVEFYFWGGGYARDDEKTILRPNWLDFAFDVSRDIERIADSFLRH